MSEGSLNKKQAAGAENCAPEGVEWVWLDLDDTVYDFAENNFLRDHKLYVNETDSVWFGVSAFFAMGLGEILRHYGNILPKQVYDRWYAIFTRIAENFNAQFVKATNSINYSAGAAGLFALAYNITKDEKYKVSLISPPKSYPSAIANCGI